MNSMMTPEEVAAYLRIQPNTLKVWRAEGVGPVCHRYNSKVVRYRRADVDAWLDMRRTAGVDVWVKNTDGS